jgi:hypothetical protein
VIHEILLGDFSANMGREGIFKLIIENENLHKTSNANGIRIVNFAASKHLIVKSNNKMTEVCEQLNFIAYKLIIT